MIIAIDGPAGSGKSTVAKMLAKRLGFRYLDTGAMYRALTWKAMQKNVNLNDENALCQLMDKTSIEFHKKDESLHVFVDSVNVTEEIRLPSVTNNVHYISNTPGIRRRMVELQRKLAGEGNTVAEGRDMGTVVFPHAERKFFLDAEIEVRARRRYGEFKPSEHGVSYTDVIHDMETRDRRDTTRNNAPLTKSSDAIYINTTKLTIEEVMNLILKEIGLTLKK
ncbi:MAG: (d)CMP kinase [Candidatus Brocadia sp.]|nr:(d)CMP kinase [Candidatus Brocadia sp.]